MTSPCGEVDGLVECPGPPVCVVSIVRSGDILQVSVSFRCFSSFDVYQMYFVRTKNMQCILERVFISSTIWTGSSKESAARHQCWQDFDSGELMRLLHQRINLESRDTKTSNDREMRAKQTSRLCSITRSCRQTSLTALLCWLGNNLMNTYSLLYDPVVWLCGICIFC